MGWRRDCQGYRMFYFHCSSNSTWCCQSGSSQHSASRVIKRRSEWITHASFLLLLLTLMVSSVSESSRFLCLHSSLSSCLLSVLFSICVLSFIGPLPIHAYRTFVCLFAHLIHIFWHSAIRGLFQDSRRSKWVVFWRSVHPKITTMANVATGCTKGVVIELQMTLRSQNRFTHFWGVC